MPAVRIALADLVPIPCNLGPFATGACALGFNPTTNPRRSSLENPQSLDSSSIALSPAWSMMNATPTQEPVAYAADPPPPSCSTPFLRHPHLRPERRHPPKCTFSATPISFGTIDIRNGRPYDATGTFDYTCTGAPREIVRICPSFGIPKDGPRYLTDDAGHKLFFDLYTDEARSDVWGSWFAKTKAPTIDEPIDHSQKTSNSVTIYGLVAPGQQDIPPGVYKSDISGGNSVTLYSYASHGACVGSINGPSAHPAVSISARVGNGDPSAQPLTAPDAARTTGGSPQSSSPQPQEHHGFWQSTGDNAKYQQDKQNGTLTDDERSASRDRNHPPSGSKPLCKMSDSDVRLADGTWAGLNCIAVDASGKPVYKPGERPSVVDDEQTNRAAYIESHSCMTTLGTDKADALADDCTRATQSPHSACNIQQNTCDEITDATKRGCDSLGIRGPDFCLLRYR